MTIEKCRAPKGRTADSTARTGVSEERCSADRAENDGERSGDRHENGLAFRVPRSRSSSGEGARGRGLRR